MSPRSGSPRNPWDFPDVDVTFLAPVVTCLQRQLVAAILVLWVQRGGRTMCPLCARCEGCCHAGDAGHLTGSTKALTRPQTEGLKPRCPSASQKTSCSAMIILWQGRKSVCLTETFSPFNRQDPFVHLLICSSVHRKRASLRQGATLGIFRVRTISCSDEPVESNWREKCHCGARVLPPNCPSKASHFAGNWRFPGSRQACFSSAGRSPRCAPHNHAVNPARPPATTDDGISFDKTAGLKRFHSHSFSPAINPVTSRRSLKNRTAQKNSMCCSVPHCKKLLCSFAPNTPGRTQHPPATPTKRRTD